MSTEAKDEEGPEVTVSAEGKALGTFYTAVRDRGLLNAMLDGPARLYEDANQKMKCRWEFAPANGDTTMVVAREAMGFKVVDYSELPGTESSKKSGPVRRGDLILMAGPKKLVAAIAREDAQRAEEDVKLPETTYRDNLEATRTRRRDGEIDQARATGGVRRVVQEVRPKQELGGE